MKKFGIYKIKSVKISIYRQQKKVIRIALPGQICLMHMLPYDKGVNPYLNTGVSFLENLWSVLEHIAKAACSGEKYIF